MRVYLAVGNQIGQEKLKETGNTLEASPGLLVTIMSSSNFTVGVHVLNQGCQTQFLRRYRRGAGDVEKAGP